jgi:hypothetical protein
MENVPIPQSSANPANGELNAIDSKSTELSVASNSDPVHNEGTSSLSSSLAEKSAEIFEVSSIQTEDDLIDFDDEEEDDEGDEDEEDAEEQPNATPPSTAVVNGNQEQLPSINSTLESKTEVLLWLQCWNEWRTSELSHIFTLLFAVLPSFFCLLRFKSQLLLNHLFLSLLTFFRQTTRSPLLELPQSPIGDMPRVTLEQVKASAKKDDVRGALIGLDVFEFLLREREAQKT